MKSALFFITFFFTSFFCIAQSDNIEFDSLVNYQVKKKETLYSISKKFNVQIDDILLFNSELKNNKLKKNSIIIVPLKKKIVPDFNLKKIIKKYLPNNKEKKFNNIVSSKPNEFFVAEYIREACIQFLSVELPYSLHVEINKFENEENLISVAATIYLKKNSHLSIVIGKNGSMLTKISKLARINSEKLFNKKVYLKIFVKYDPRWKDSENFLNSYN